MRQILKIKKVDKGIAIVLNFLLPALFLEMSFASVDSIYPLPSLLFYLPLYAILLYTIAIYLVRNLIYHYRIIFTHMFVLLVIANLFYAYFLVRVGMMQSGIVMWIIFAFMGLFYGTFLLIFNI